MKKFFHRIKDIILSYIHKDMFVYVDGMYNTIVLSGTLYQHLLVHSRMRRSNQVFLFLNTEQDNPRYSFCAYKSIEPILTEEIATNELKLSKETHFVCFQTDLVANILQKYNLPPVDVTKVMVLPRKMVYRDNEGRAIHKYIYYELQPPTKRFG